MAELLNLGTSALLSLQRAIATTGHNIANANTEGYSRQSVHMATQAPQFLGGEYYGSGVSVDSVERFYDQYIATDVRNRTSSQARFQSYSDLASRLDGLMADPAVGLGPVIETFFAAVQDVANNPGSAPERRVLLGEAEGLADRFHYLDTNFDNLSAEINGRIEASVVQINSLVDGIAELNGQVAQTTGLGAGQAANDLMDSRDRMLNELARYINVSTLEQSDGSLNVMIGNGQPLVVGQTAEHLQTLDDPADPTRIIVTTARSGIDLGRSIEGGELGALMTFREQTLDPARNQLGLVAAGLASTFNAQHQLGLDLQGQPGGDFFTPLAATQIAHANNSNLSAITATIDDVGSLTGDDYKISYAAGQWTLTNQATQASQVGPGPFTVDGMTIAVSGAPVDGDSFIIQPTRQSAGQFSVALNDPAGYAAASPLRAQSALSNTGAGEVSSLNVTSATGLPLVGEVTLTFNPDAMGPGVPGYDVAGIAGGPLAYDPATDSNGKTFSLGGFDVTLSGAPQDGDELTINNNVNGTGDNRNGLSLANLQSNLSLLGGTASYQDAYGNLVVEVGVQTSQAQTTNAVETILLEQATSARDSLSGVNLDEEAANLIRYQQAYQAAAQTIAVADQLFQTLLDATRR